jgi:hypothetical protein
MKVRKGVRKRNRKKRRKMNMRGMKGMRKRKMKISQRGMKGYDRSRDVAVCVLPAPVDPTIAVVVPAATVKLTRLRPCEKHIKKREEC